MKTVELTEYERNNIRRAITFIMHWHREQATKCRLAGHPTLEKRNELEAKKFEELLNKIGD